MRTLRDRTHCEDCGKSIIGQVRGRLTWWILFKNRVLCKLCYGNLVLIFVSLGGDSIN